MTDEPKYSDEDVQTNSAEEGSETIGDNAAAHLKSYVERVERLEEEKRAMAADIREVYAEAKGNGFEAKILRKVVALRRMEKADRDEEAALTELYLRALGL